MLIIVTPLIVAVVGLLMYALAVNPKVAEIGRVMLAVGLFWALAHVGGAVGLLRL